MYSNEKKTSPPCPQFHAPVLTNISGYTSICITVTFFGANAPLDHGQRAYVTFLQVWGGLAFLDPPPSSLFHT